MVFNFKDLFYLFFLTNVMGIRIEHAGMITAIGTVWDAINDPMLVTGQQTTPSKTAKSAATAAQPASCHAADENVTVSSLAEGVRFFKHFLKDYTMQPSP